MVKRKRSAKEWDELVRLAEVFVRMHGACRESVPGSFLCSNTWCHYCALYCAVNQINDGRSREAEGE